MSMHLFTRSFLQLSSSANETMQIQLLCGYENGSVTLWKFTRTDKHTSVEGVGWEATWNVKLHVETSLCHALIALISNIANVYDWL